MNNNWLQAWDMAADDVIAAALFDMSLVEVAAGSLITALHFPPEHRAIWLALEKLHTQDLPVLNETQLVNALVGEDATLNLKRLAHIYALYEPSEHPVAFESNLELLKKRWFTGFVLEQMAITQKNVNNGEDATIASQGLIRSLTDINPEPPPPTDAASLTERFAYNTTAQGKPLRTGHSILDKIMPAFLPGELEVVVAAYKWGKSTYLRNKLLFLLENNPDIRVGVVQLEDGIEPIYWDFVAMLASKWFLDQGLWHEVDQQGRPLNIISGQDLMKSQGKWRNYDPKRRAAVDWAIEHYKGYGDRMILWDQTRENGKVGTLSAILGKMRYQNRFGPLDVIGVDYAQRIKADIDDNFDPIKERLGYFDNVATCAHVIRNACAEYNVAGILLAQQNEEGVKQAQAGTRNQSHSSHVKGGGDLSAACNYLVRTEYGENSQALDWKHLWFYLHHARRGPAGRPEHMQRLPLHEQTRLITDPNDKAKPTTHPMLIP